MININVLLALLIVLSAVQCKKKEDCHYNISIVNKSNIEVVVATVGIGGEEGTCGFERIKKVGSGADVNDYPLSYIGHGCIENSDLSTALPIVVLAPNEYVEGITNCDSVREFSTILKDFTSEFKDLESNNFTLTYP